MKKKNKVLHWAPRIISILAIMLISLFAFDSFNPSMTIIQQIGAFLMHLIPTFALIALLIVAWKWEFIGGLIFTLIGLGFIPFIFLHNYRMNHSLGMSVSIVMMINMPFVIVGILFIINHFKKRGQTPDR